MPWDDWSTGSGWSTGNWYTWNTTYSTQTLTSAASTVIWNTWTSSSTMTYTTGLSDAYPRSVWAVEPGARNTSDEWAQIEREHAAASAVREKQEAAAITASAKLLAMVLTEAQLASFEAQQFFELIGASGQLWRVRYGTSGNVRAIDSNGEEIMAVCAHPQLWDDEHGHLPTADVLAAQALHLIHDDAQFLRTANIHRGASRRLELAPALQAATQRGSMAA